VSLDAARLVPTPGEGVLARFAGVVLLTLPAAEENAAAMTLVDLCRNVAGPLPGQALARRIAAQPPVQIQITKRLLNQSLSVAVVSAKKIEDIAQAANFGSRDTTEAILAFVERREPRFTGE